jgi:hypothetical protein
LLSAIVKGLNVGSNGVFLMFVVYLTNNDESLTKELFQISECILDEFAPSSFTEEVEFYNSKSHPEFTLSVEPDSIDLEKSRNDRRAAADMARKEKADQQQSSQLNLFLDNPGYSDQLPTASKIAYGVSCIEILGQILRNFTGSLHGDQKLAILDTTYRLGLRIGRAILMELSTAALKARAAAATLDPHEKETREFQKILEKFLFVLGQIIGISVVTMISTNVGSPDIEADAYLRTLERVGRTNATELVHLAIKLDHAGSDDYPLYLIKNLHERFQDNLFAQRVLADLVVGNMYVFDIGRTTRQKVLSTLGIKAPSEAMLSKRNKRLG